MMLEKRTLWPNPPRVPLVREADNGIALTTQQILQTAGVLGSTVEDELAVLRSAWIGYQSSRERDAVYKYLTAVFEIVSRWKRQHRAKAKSHQALAATEQCGAIRIEEPFAVVIYCTSDPHKVDARRETSGREHFDTPGDLSQIIRALPSSSKPGAASTNVPPSSAHAKALRRVPKKREALFPR